VSDREAYLRHQLALGPESCGVPGDCTKQIIDERKLCKKCARRLLDFKLVLRRDIKEHIDAG
jgi:hypothetical protein